MVVESIIEYALRIRELRRAGPSNLEQALAPEFQRLLESLLPHISAKELVVVPEFATPGVGRPDIALKRAGQPARAFIELKAPTKPGDLARYRDAHDKRQFIRFQSLPVWAISNFSSLRVFERDVPKASIEIVVGPYAVAHYRLRHAMGALQAKQRVGVFLADTLAEPGAAAPEGKLGFVADNIRTERHEADRIKQRQPILAIIGNPPYRRLATGEIGELVGDWMDELWDDLKEPVRNAGWANQLNTFPEFSIAFWRWAIWKIFESEGAPGRGVVAFISNRTFLAGKPYAGLHKMLRERFDSIEIIDLRGDVRRGERAGITSDQGVFNIQVGAAITLAIADRRKADGELASVSYIDSWAEGLFARDSKFVWLKAGEETGTRPGAVEVAREPLDDMKPEPFQNGEWPGLSNCFTFKRSGVQTKRDDFIYSFSHNALRERIAEFLAAPDDRARVMFHDSRDRKWVGARHPLRWQSNC